MQTTSKTLSSQFRTILFGTGLTTLFMGISASAVSAQVTPFTIQSTGTLSGTIELPSFNPNFNNRVTRVDTDSNGTYSRNGKPVYSSSYVKMETRADGSLKYYVDFKGIPVISTNGAIASPVLSGGELQDYKYQGRLDGTKFQAVVQDEFGLKAGFYKGIVTDPKTGQQYEGTFKVKGQGPRYSDSNGGESPTVFDFKSDIPGKPSITSLEMNNSPLVKLYIEVPADAVPITPGGGSTTTGGSSTTDGSTTTGGSSTTDGSSTTGGNSTSGGSSTTSQSSTTGGNSTTSESSATSQSSATTTNSTTNSSTVTGVNNPITPPSSITTNVTSPTNSDVSSPSTTPDIEFSSGNSFAVNSVITNSSNSRETGCSLNSVKCSTKKLRTKKNIGPRSRVLLR